MFLSKIVAVYADLNTHTAIVWRYNVNHSFYICDFNLPLVLLSIYLY
jgi:hypothetical protein